MTSPLQPASGRNPLAIPGGIAERLRRAREEHGMSVEELSVKTRIPLRHLETIEAGRGAELPGGFIGGSFVRQYAQAVGMNPEQALRDFAAQSGLNLDVPFEERKISPYTPESIQKFHAKVWRQVGIGATALLVVALVIMYFLTRPEAKVEAPVTPTPRPLPSYLEPDPAESAAPAPATATNAPSAVASGTVPPAGTRTQTPMGSSSAIVRPAGASLSATARSAAAVESGTAQPGTPANASPEADISTPGTPDPPADAQPPAQQ